MNSVSESISEYLSPVMSGPLAHALIGLAILIIGLFLVKFIGGILTRMLKKISFLNRQGEGKSTDLVSPISSLIKAVLTIFVLMAVLQHFGLTDVLTPLRDMVGKFTAAIPNIIGAGVIGYAGWIIAKLVAELTGLALRKVDQQIAARTGNDEFEVSRFGSAFMFGAILLPIIVSALGVLNIAAISDPASAMIQKLMSAVPNIVGAGIILLVAYFASKFVVFMLTGLLDGAKIDELPAKIGAETLFSESFTPTRLVGGAIMFFSMLAAATAAVNVLGIDVISEIFARVLEFGGGILVGGLILIVGNFLGSIAHQKLVARGSDAVANVARVAILGLVLAMGLKSMGLADNIVNMAFGFTIGSAALAAAVAFGIGGQGAAKVVADRWARKLSND